MNERETNAHTKNRQNQEMVRKDQESRQTSRKVAQEDRGHKTPLGTKRQASTRIQQR